MAGSSNFSHLQERQQYLSSYQPIYIHNSFSKFSKVFEFVMRDHISYYLNYKLKSANTSLLTYLDFGSLFFWDVAHHQWLQTTQ